MALSVHSGESLRVSKILVKVIERRGPSLKHSPLSSDESTVEVFKPPESAAKARKKDPMLPKMSTLRTFPYRPSPRPVLFHERSLRAGNILWSNPLSSALTNILSILGPSEGSPNTSAATYPTPPSPSFLFPVALRCRCFSENSGLLREDWSFLVTAHSRRILKATSLSEGPGE